MIDAEDRLAAAPPDRRELIEGTHRALAPLYPAMPACLVAGDEPEDDFGIAHYLGLDARGCALTTFDAPRLPSRPVVAHELAHAMHQRAGGWPFAMDARDVVLRGFWLLRFPNGPTLEEAISVALDVERRSGSMNAWPYYVGEILADTFALLTYGRVAGGAYFYGVPLSDPDCLVAYFRALRRAIPPAPEEVDDMTDEQLEAALRRVLPGIFLELTRQHITPTLVAIKDAFNDHGHDLGAGTTGGPIVKLGNEPEGG